MIRQLEAVFFDLDGTLLDTAPDFHRVVNLMRQQDQLAPVTMELMREQVSNGAGAMVCAAYGIAMDDPRYEPLRLRMLDIYSDQLAVDTRLYPGIEGLLGWLESKQRPWGIATNKPARFTLPLLQQLQLDKRSAATICPDHVRNRKPDPESLLIATEALKLNPENCVYVGDHLRDIECGKRAGMTTIAAGYGYIDRSDCAEDWGADHIVHQSGDIQPLLQSLYTLS
ncbi:HAD family hydrolase [Marinobacterium jannaschii]|uniref:HAD family hydrolase n=1 Tax=Marinobacterium jannaschii TaxID=64970 RepID=UPI0004808CA2|nr:HAD-IA family hydrolase [Marinobacterium jannaschii]